MESDYDRFETVYVIDGHRLIDPESYERQYQRPDGLSLAPGYYVASWPESVRTRRFDERALFHGPFERRPVAQAVLERLAALDFPRLAGGRAAQPRSSQPSAASQAFPAFPLALALRA
jgi:hypothetical protein